MEGWSASSVRITVVSPKGRRASAEAVATMGVCWSARSMPNPVRWPSTPLRRNHFIIFILVPRVSPLPVRAAISVARTVRIMRYLRPLSLMSTTTSCHPRRWYRSVGSTTAQALPTPIPNRSLISSTSSTPLVWPTKQAFGISS